MSPRAVAPLRGSPWSVRWLGDGAADGRKRRKIVELDRRAPQRDPEPAKESAEIDFGGRRTHLRVQLLEHLRSHRAVPDFERAPERPALGDASPLRYHGAKRVLEPEAIAGALPDLHVGEQPEQRAAPVGAAPGMRSIEALVARLGETLRQAAHEVAPHSPGAQLADPRARDRLDVGGEAFLYPKVPPGQRREAEMDHLVHQLPAALRCGEVHLGAEEEEDRSAAGPPAAAMDLVATRGQHEEERAVGGEAPEVSLDERGRIVDPAEQFFLAL